MGPLVDDDRARYVILLEVICRSWWSGVLVHDEEGHVENDVGMI